jgi:hypothetical protein
MSTLMVDGGLSWPRLARDDLDAPFISFFLEATAQLIEARASAPPYTSRSVLDDLRPPLAPPLRAFLTGLPLSSSARPAVGIRLPLDSS